MNPGRRKRVFLLPFLIDTNCYVIDEPYKPNTAALHKHDIELLEASLSNKNCQG